MLARKIVKLTIIAIIFGHAIGNLPVISELYFFVNLTPSSQGISSGINTAAASGLSLSMIFCLISTVIYSLLNKEDIALIQVFEWYGCLIFGGALFVFFYWLALNIWSTTFPEIQYGRGARALYRASLESELWLGAVSFLLLLMGNLGLYLLAKIPFSLRDSSPQSGSNSQ
ncbi:hypothetical protein [Geopseudomonas sagittaria]|uniref:hypothetical protein n=1 Tax=Geopseudomonas sagittaria TaxID=1135990 RepID=UPI001113D685|nr:hypothetical protein [Pseudomonas sagittaria]